MNKRTIGSQYEDMAKRYLITQGVLLLESNFRVRTGEIDIIGKQGNTLVFFEVKYRKNNRAGSPLEAVSYRKQKQICKTAMYYINKYKVSSHMNIRFDVIGISEKEISWIQNAFPYV